MKKAFILVLSLIMLVSFASPVASETAIAKIKIKGKLTLYKDCDGVTIVPTIKPAGADEGVVWSSSNVSAVTVDAQTGYAEAVGTGKSTITCASLSGKVKATCKVTAKIKPPTIALSAKKLTMEPGDTSTLTASFLPRTADFSDAVWTSSNENVAAVRNGVITALSKGTAKITCSSARNGKKAVCNVTVKKSPLTAQVVSVSIYHTYIDRYANGSPKSVTFTYWIKNDKAGTARLTQSTRQTVAMYQQYDFDATETINLTKGDNVIQRTIDVVNYGGTTSDSLIFTVKIQSGGAEKSAFVRLPLKGLVKP